MTDIRANPQKKTQIHTNLQSESILDNGTKISYKQRTQGLYRTPLDRVRGAKWGEKNIMTDRNEAQRHVQARHSEEKSPWSALVGGTWSAQCDTASKMVVWYGTFQTLRNP